jgi:hypothetical protein
MQNWKNEKNSRFIFLQRAAHHGPHSGSVIGSVVKMQKLFFLK